MAIRLNKALKELNVGINTVAEFLQKKGAPLEDASPNAKLTDPQYDLLVKEFGNDKTKHAEVKADIQKRKEREEKEKQERKEQQRLEKERERQEKEKKQQFKIVGNINDMNPQSAENNVQKKKKEVPAPQENATTDPQIIDTPSEPQKKASPKRRHNRNNP